MKKFICIYKPFPKFGNNKIVHSYYNIFFNFGTKKSGTNDDELYLARKMVV